ncbi:MAG: hypothetical protein WCJ94_00160 [bacterium]
MKCAKVSSLLYDFKRTELDAVTTKTIENHLKTCKACESELKKLVKLSTLFKVTLREPSLSVLTNIKRIVNQKRQTLFTLIFKPAFAMATAVLLLVGVFLYPNLEKKTKLSNILIDDYNIAETALYETSDIEEVSYIYDNEYNTEVF